MTTRKKKPPGVQKPRGRVKPDRRNVTPSRRKSELPKTAVCDAKTSKAGKCSKCGFKPTPDANGAFKRHMGVCEQCGGTMRCTQPWQFLGKNGRCRTHAGRAVAGPAHPHWKGGRTRGWTKYLPPDFAATYRRMANDPDKLNTETLIDLLNTMLAKLLQKQTGQGAWKGVRAGVTQLRAALKKKKGPDRDKDIDASVETLEKFLGMGLEDDRIRNEVRGLAEDISRISSREGQRQTAAKMHLTYEQGVGILMLLAKSVTEQFTAIPGLFLERAATLNGAFSLQSAEKLVATLCTESRTVVARDLIKIMEKAPSTVPEMRKVEDASRA